MSRPAISTASPVRRWAVLLTLLAGSAALVMFSEPPGTASAPVRAVARKTVAANQKRGTAAPQTSAPAPSLDVISASRKAGTPGEAMILAIAPRAAATPDAPRDAFSTHSWNPPPPPPPPRLPPAPPPQPVAPPLPFTFLGKQQQDGQWHVFLGRADRTIIAKVGLVLDNTYRVDSIAPPQMQITYLPLGQKQVLFVGAER